MLMAMARFPPSPLPVLRRCMNHFCARITSRPSGLHGVRMALADTLAAGTVSPRKTAALPRSGTRRGLQKQAHSRVDVRRAVQFRCLHPSLDSSCCTCEYANDEGRSRHEANEGNEGRERLRRRAPCLAECLASGLRCAPPSFLPGVPVLDPARPGPGHRPLCPDHAPITAGGQRWTGHACVLTAGFARNPSLEATPQMRRSFGKRL